MLCLRRISLDAKSRLLFLSRSHSSTNDSMPKSTAISRLIHKKFLQQNGNNSPQAIFVFLQQRSLRTRAHALVQPVLEEKDKSAEDKDQKGKSVRRFFLHLGGVVLAFSMFTAGTWVGRFHILTSKIPEDDKSAKDRDEEYKSIRRYHFNLGVVIPFAIYTVSTFFERLRSKVPEDKDKSDAKYSEFKFDCGEKPKNIFEKIFYRKLEKFFENVSEERFKKIFKEIDLDQIRRFYFNLGAGVVSAICMYTVWTAWGRLILRTQALKGKDKSVRRFFFNLGAGVVLAFTMFTVGTIFESSDILTTIVPDDKDKSSDHKDNSDAKDSEFKFGFGPNGAKPKNEFEKYLYRYLHKRCMKKWEKEFFKSMNPKKYVPLFGLVCCGILALLTAMCVYDLITTFVALSLPASIALFTVLLPLSYLGVQAFSRSSVLLEYDMKSGTK
ncbi:hypothetical protein Ddc_16378 [Ditylenchus destructor]|nr:hypothetical protein Ddc_16378 [Ditylenchus destructor]